VGFTPVRGYNQSVMSAPIDRSVNYPLLVLFGLLMFVIMASIACAGVAPDREPGVVESNAQTNVTEDGNSSDVTSTDAPRVEKIPQSITDTPSFLRATEPDQLVHSTVELISTPEDETQICSPLEGHAIDELPGIVSASYDPPPPGKEKRHHGVDFSYYRRGERESILGVGVQSVFEGRVVTAMAESFPYGNFVIVETPAARLPASLLGELELEGGQSLYLLYAHLQNPPLVSTGDVVLSCQLLGDVGKSGNAGIAHLHLEARIGPQGAVLERMAYYHTQTSAEERSNYELWRTSGTFKHLDPMRIFTFAE